VYIYRDNKKIALIDKKFVFMGGAALLLHSITAVLHYIRTSFWECKEHATDIQGDNVPATNERSSALQAEISRLAAQLAITNSTNLGNVALIQSMSVAAAAQLSDKDTELSTMQSEAEHIKSRNFDLTYQLSMALSEISTQKDALSATVSSAAHTEAKNLLLAQQFACELSSAVLSAQNARAEVNKKDLELNLVNQGLSSAVKVNSECSASLKIWKDAYHDITSSTCISVCSYLLGATEKSLDNTIGNLIP